MDLEKDLCANCNKGFEDGHILLKHKNKLYHHMVDNDTPPLLAILSCSLAVEDGEGKVGVYYKNKFYDLKKNKDKLEDVNVSYANMIHTPDSIGGHCIIGDISFLDNCESD